MGTSITVLAVTCSVFITYEYLTFRKTIVRSLATRGEIIAANSTAALAFQNESDARDVLSAFRMDPHVVAACLYDRDGRLFARYPADAPAGSFPSAPEPVGSRFEKAQVVVFLPVAQGNRRLGTVYLKSDLSAMSERFRLYAVLVAFVVAISLVVAFALSTRFQRRVLEPILDLAKTARNISEQKDYALRAGKLSDDEIGQLTDSFNDMLGQIQERDTALRKTEGEVRKLNVELEQRVAERTEQLEESRGQLASVLESLGEGVVVADRDGKFVLFNPAAERILGMGATETGPAQWPETYGVFLPDAVTPFPAEEQPLARAIRGESSDDVEIFIRNPQVPAGVSISISGRPIYDAAGAIRRGVIVFRDITERKRAEQMLAERTVQLEAANKELESFAYSVSHDLRAPLRSIDGFSQILLEDFADRLGSEGQRSLTRIRAATQRMGHLIDDLLKLSQITRAEIRKENVDLSALARHVAAEVQEREPGRSVSVDIAEGVSVEGDARLLGVVLENLIGNAFKFTAKKPEPKIEFGIGRDGGGPLYFVRDNGAGFDMTYAGKLFGPFQRLHAAEEFRGTGIGLATVQRIIHRHGGRVWAEAAVDQGATFYFTLQG